MPVALPDGLQGENGCLASGPKLTPWSVFQDGSDAAMQKSFDRAQFHQV